MAKRNNTTDGAKRAAARKRNFATIVYPESAPPEWLDRLGSMHVPALISPLHDRDINPDGNPKKPHYHVLLLFDTPQDFDTAVKPIFEAIGAVGREAVNNKRGYARYLCHMDNPEKAQYDPADVTALAGADFKATIHLPSDDVTAVRDIMNFVRVNHIHSFAEMCDIAAACNDDWYNLIITSRGYIIEKYIKSLTWEAQSDYTRSNVADPVTGEIISMVDDIKTSPPPDGKE